MKSKITSLMKSIQCSQLNPLKSYAYSMFFSLILLSLFCAGISMAYSKNVVLNAQLSQTAVEANQKQKIYVKVGLKGLEAELKERTALNLSLVLDRSGSMSGRNLKYAKQAAHEVVHLLRDQDTLSLVAYDDEAEVILPATTASHRSLIHRTIDQIRADGSTALHAGVVLGAKEVRSFFAQNKVNRVILLSDGIANVGPSSPQDLAQLGQRLAKEGISVSTLGLGLNYNEDLMAQLALRSEGNHVFIESPKGLPVMMKKELGDALAVVGQDAQIHIEFGNQIRPVRSLGRDADFKGQKVKSTIKQIIGGHEKYILIELEVQSLEQNAEYKIAEIEVEYFDAVLEKKLSFTQDLTLSVLKDKALVAKSEIPVVMEEVITLIANERQEYALQLRDQGKTQEAYKIAQQNRSYLKKKAKKYNSKKLKKLEFESDEEAEMLIQGDWKRNRKAMKRRQFQKSVQQAY